MTLYSKVTKLREELLENCKHAICELKAVKEKVLSVSNQENVVTVTAGAEAKTQETATSGTKKPESNISYEISDKTIMNSFMELIHGVLIQEWEHFLYDIYAEGFVHYLNLGSPQHRLRLKDLNPEMEVADMRQHICKEIKNSFRGYELLFSETRKFFKVENDKLFKEMQKQIQIRHIFQHNRGKIRKKDFSDIGRNGADECFEILNDNEKSAPNKYREGQDISLSLPEIQKLCDTIEKYSEVFQKKAENAKPVKPV